jgi:hypothetical protein
VTIADRYRKGSLATETVVDGVITTIRVTTPGSNYLDPIVDITDATGTGATTIAVLDKATLTPLTGMRKFRDSLSDLLLAVADTVTYPGCDYYEISIEEYTVSMQSDIPLTKRRGYRQTNTATPSSRIDPSCPAKNSWTLRIPPGTWGPCLQPRSTSAGNLSGTATFWAMKKKT